MSNTKHKIDDWSDYFNDAASSYKSNEEIHNEPVLHITEDYLYDEPVVTVIERTVAPAIQVLPNIPEDDFSMEAQKRLLEEQIKFADAEFDMFMVEQSLQGPVDVIAEEVKDEQPVIENAVETAPVTEDVQENDIAYNPVAEEYKEEAPVVEEIKEETKDEPKVTEKKEIKKPVKKPVAKKPTVKKTSKK